jgi:hypothetical protein
MRRRRTTLEACERPMRFALLDPPYVNTARKWYGYQPDYAGEVDHPKLIAETMAGGFDGWALACSAKSLRFLLPLMPEETRVCAWVKPIGVPPATKGIHNTWEALLVVGGRQRPPGRRDWLKAQPARHGGDLPGRKPMEWCMWAFDLLGMLPGDELVDKFPGTGGIGRAWEYLSSLRSGARPFGEYSSDVTVEAYHVD